MKAVEINKQLIENLLAQAVANPRLRQNFDLRTTESECCQRMLNAMLPGTVLPIHRHTKSNETLVLLRGRIEEVFYDESFCETSRVLLEAGGDVQGLSIPVGQWHSVNVLEPSVIMECKDGKYEPLPEEDVIKAYRLPHQ